MVCKQCKDKFIPKYFLQKWCLEKDECIKAFSNWVSEQNKKKIDKAMKKDTAERKEKLKGLPEFKKLLEIQVNTIARLIDKDCGCISCGGHTTPQAGHYHSVQSNGSIRYNLDNLHLQDYNCNCAKGANTHKYDLGLIERYGKEYWEYVKFEIVLKYPELRITVSELKEKVVIAKGIVDELKGMCRLVPYTPTERKVLRNKYNQILGLYK